MVSMLSSLNALSAFGVNMYPTEPMPTLVRSAFLGTFPTALIIPCSDCFGSYRQCTWPEEEPRKSWLILGCHCIVTIDPEGTPSFLTSWRVDLSYTWRIDWPAGVPSLFLRTLVPVRNR